MKKGTDMATILVKLEPGNSARLKKLQAVIKRLPPLEQRLWKGRIVAKLKSGPTPVIGDATGEWGSTKPAAPEAEWDLELANWLDSTYTIVAQRAEEVGDKVVRGATSATAAVGFSVWPLAIAAAVVLYAFASAKRA